MSNKPDWYEYGDIYKKNLNLADWGDELQWRYELLMQINKAKLPRQDCYCTNSYKELRKIYGEERRKEVVRKKINCEYVNGRKRYGLSLRDENSETREQLKRSFLCCVADSNNCDQQHKLGENIGVPLRGVSRWGIGLELDDFFGEPRYDSKDYDAIDNITHEEGLIFPLIVNTSYDKKTLLKNFEDVLDNYYNGIEHQNLLPSRPTKKAKGLEIFTENDAQTWNRQKLLHYIDIDILWRGIVGDCLGKYPKERLLDFFWEGMELNHDEAYISGTVAPQAKRLLNGIVISRVKASAKTLIK